MLTSLQKTASCEWIGEKAMSSTSQSGWHPNVIHLDPLPSALSLILQLLVSLLIESKACLSLVSKCRKSSKRAWNKPSLLTQCVFLMKSIHHRATLPSPGSLFLELWLLPTQTVLQRVLIFVGSSLVFSLQSTAVELKMKWVKEI